MVTDIEVSSVNGVIVRADMYKHLLFIYEKNKTHSIILFDWLQVILYWQEIFQDKQGLELFTA
jgi:hypothetical protein